MIGRIAQRGWNVGGVADYDKDRVIDELEGDDWGVLLLQEFSNLRGNGGVTPLERGGYLLVSDYVEGTARRGQAIIFRKDAPACVTQCPWCLAAYLPPRGVVVASVYLPHRGHTGEVHQQAINDVVATLFSVGLDGGPAVLPTAGPAQKL